MNVCLIHSWSSQYAQKFYLMNMYTIKYVAGTYRNIVLTLCSEFSDKTHSAGLIPMTVTPPYWASSYNYIISTTRRLITLNFIDHVSVTTYAQPRRLCLAVVYH